MILWILKDGNDIVVFIDMEKMKEKDDKNARTTQPVSSIKPGKLFKLLGRRVPFKDCSKLFPKVKLRRLLGNGTWPCYASDSIQKNAGKN